MRLSAWQGTLVLLLSVALTGCPAPDTPMDKVGDAARNMNIAARFGRMDVAVEATAPEFLAAFNKRHAAWHNSVRIVDTELTGIEMKGPQEANAQVDVSWLFVDESVLRETKVSQNWKNFEGKWLLTAEKRIGGSTGLFGEKVERKDQGADQHFPTRVIHDAP